MAEPPLRLRHGDMLHALGQLDLLSAMEWELVRRTTGAADRGTGRPANLAGLGATAGLTAVEDPDGGRVCLMPTPSLQMIGLAGLAGLAARALLPPGVVTAAVFGAGAAARLHLGLIGDYMPNVSEAAVHPAAGNAAVGANLLVVAELGWDSLDIGHLRPGVLVINATRRDLPDELLVNVDRVYVDDFGMLEHNQHRKFVRLHLAGSGRQPEPPHQSREGWYRSQPLWRYHRRIDADLGQVLAGGQRRAVADDVLLVELLGGGSLDAWLASQLYRAAVPLGLGRGPNDSEME